MKAQLEKLNELVVSKGGRELGVLFSDLEENLFTPAEYKKFTAFMRGQTCGILGSLNDEYVSYAYTGDVRRFIQGLPCID